MILLKTYFNSSNNDLFLTEWNRITNNLSIEKDLEALHSLIQLKYIFLIKEASLKNGDFKEIFSFWKSYKKDVINLCYEIYINYCYKYNAIVRNIHNIEFSNNAYNEMKTESIELNEFVYKHGIESLSNQNRFKYNMTQVANVKTQHTQAIQLLLDSIELLDKNDNENLLRTYQALSFMTGYYEMDEEKVYFYITKAYENLTPEMITKDLNIIVIRDRIICQYVTGRIEECITFFEKYQKILEKNLVDYLYVVNVMLLCYMLNGDFSKAFHLIPTDFSKVSQYNLYNFKLFFVLILIKRKEYEIAKREINNSLKTLSKINLGFDSYTHAFEALYKLLKKKTNPKSKITDEEILEFTKLEPENLEDFKRDFPKILKKI